MDKNKAIPNEEAVRGQLREAFPVEDARVASALCTHEELVEVRSSICSFRKEDLPLFLGQVLLDLLDTHTGDPIDSEDADQFIVGLDGSLDRVSVDALCDTFGEEQREEMKAASKVLTQFNTGTFDCVNQKQANAIVSWLELAKTWDDYKFEYEQEKINAALKFWRERCGK
jgi:hypothetical protein